MYSSTAILKFRKNLILRKLHEERRSAESTGRDGWRSSHERNTLLICREIITGRIWCVIRNERLFYRMYMYPLSAMMRMEISTVMHQRIAITAGRPGTLLGWPQTALPVASKVPLLSSRISRTWRLSSPGPGSEDRSVAESEWKHRKNCTLTCCLWSLRTSCTSAVNELKPNRYGASVYQI